jgi:hypothetical protein
VRLHAGASLLHDVDSSLLLHIGASLLLHDASASLLHAGAIKTTHPLRSLLLHRRVHASPDLFHLQQFGKLSPSLFPSPSVIMLRSLLI